MSLFNQSWTNIASQFGMPLFGVGNTPPFMGNYFWVDQTNGSDGNTGGPQDPFKTLSRALAACTADNNDVVFFTGTIHLTSTLVWSKAKTHLIGLGVGTVGSSRSRISQTGSSVFTPLVSVTASGCMFVNVATFHGFDDASAQICWTDSGGRNYYKRCDFLGMGHATAAAQAGGRSLLVTGTTGENTFEECQIGLDTITRSAANASLELAGGTPRNVFLRCIFPAITSSAGAFFVLTAGAAAMDRFQWFQDCLFVNAVNSTSTTMTDAFSLAASSGGMAVLQRCTTVGCTGLGTAASLSQMWVDGGAPTAATTALAVNPAA